MNLFAAARLYLLGRGTDRSGRSIDGELPPIRPEAWSAWARADRAVEPLDIGLGEACLTRDGRVGRVAAVFQGETWVHVCEAALR